MKKIAIVGGGMAGLSAAHYISWDHKSKDIHIFEKEQELGGRVRTVNTGGYYIDTGAQFLTKEDKEAYKLLRTVGLTKSLRKINMNFSYYDGEQFLSLSVGKLLKNTKLSEKAEIVKLFATIKKIRVILDSLPADAIDSEYTATTFEAWYQENIGGKMLWLYDSLLRSIGFVTSEKISALYGLIIIRALFEQCYSFGTGLSELTRPLINTMQGLIVHKGKTVETLDSLESDRLVLAVPFPEAKKLLDELHHITIAYSNCTYLILNLHKRLWKKDWGIFTPKEFPISFITDETLKFTENSKDNTILGVIVPENAESDEERLLNFVINELSSLFPLSYRDIKSYRICKWKYALPVCSPEFHQNLRKIKELCLDNVYLCGDYMSLPSLDGAIESGRLAAVRLKTPTI